MPQEKNWFTEEGNKQSGEQRGNENMPAPVSYFRPLSNFFRDIDKMFDQTFRTFGVPAFQGANFMNMQMFRPNLEIASNDNEYVITAEVPGMEERDIRLDVSPDGMLTISGEKRHENTESRKSGVFSECSYGAFERSLSLPDDVDPEGIEARFRNGVLTIMCPRVPSQQRQSRPIPIGGRKGPEEIRGSNERSVPPQGPRKAA
jgi:HSP20 family protein